MTGYSIQRLRISAVVITWGNYNYGVVYNEVKNTAAQRVLHSGRRCGCRIVSEMGLQLFSSTSHIIMHS